MPTGVISPANGNREERTVRVEGLVCRLPSTLSAVFYRHALKWWVGSVALGNLSGRCSTPNISAAPSEPITETEAGLGGVEALAVVADELAEIAIAGVEIDEQVVVQVVPRAEPNVSRKAITVVDHHRPAARRRRPARPVSASSTALE